MGELDRLLGRVVQQSNDCWEWQGARTGSGYGAQQFRGRLELTHRISYLLHVGPIPDDLVIDHVCRNTICCNPEHLDAVTQGENVRRQPRVSERTQCPQGHDLAGLNAYVTPRGFVRCRACRAVASERWLTKTDGTPRDPRAHCQRGHALDAANTYVTPQGRRNCRTCRRAAAERYEARQNRGN
jgi:hypothetical protein